MKVNIAKDSEYPVYSLGKVLEELREGHYQDVELSDEKYEEIKTTLHAYKEIQVYLSDLVDIRYKEETEKYKKGKLNDRCRTS